LYLAGVVFTLILGLGVIDIVETWILVIMILGTGLAYLYECASGRYVVARSRGCVSCDVVEVFLDDVGCCDGECFDCSAPVSGESPDCIDQLDGEGPGVRVLRFHRIEKKLGEVDGAGSVAVGLKNVVVTIDPVGDRPPPRPAVLRAAVVESGFTPGAIEVVAVGTLTVIGKNTFLRLPRRSTQLCGASGDDRG